MPLGILLVNVVSVSSSIGALTALAVLYAHLRSRGMLLLAAAALVPATCPPAACSRPRETWKDSRGFVIDGGRDGVLGREAFAEMVQRQNAPVALDGEFSIGLGYWLIDAIGAGEALGSHAGEIPHFHAVLATIPGRRIGMFLAANSSRDSSALVALAAEILRAAYAEATGRPALDPPTAPRDVSLGIDSRTGLPCLSCTFAGSVPPSPWRRGTTRRQ